MPLAVLLSVAACGGDDIAWSDPLTLPATEGDARLLVDGRGRTRMVADTSVSVVPADSVHACAGSVRTARQDDGSLAAVWWSVRADSSALLLAAVSTDAGNTWHHLIRVDTADVNTTGCIRPPPAIAASGGFVHVAYAMRGSEGVGVFYAHSMNAGKSYEPAVTILYGPAGTPPKTTIRTFPPGAATSPMWDCPGVPRASSSRSRCWLDTSTY